MSEYEQAVFISYAWGAEREDIVNEIDETLQQRGVRIVRDKRALGYRGSIKDFMERIGQGNCVIVVISDKYLRSPNCMFELVEIAENKQFHDRVFPVVLSDANIYDPLKRIEYVRHWEAKRAELAKAMKKLDPANLQGIRDDMDQYDRIRDKISGITSILKDMNTLTPDMHRDSEFSNLYDAVVKRMEESATNVTTEFNDMAKKADGEHQAKEEADRLATQKTEAERLAQQKAEEERLAQAKIEADRKVKEETDRLAIQKAEAEQLAQQKAEEARLAQAKIEADRKTREETEHLAVHKAEEERLEKEKAKPVEASPAGVKVTPIPTQSTQKKPVRVGLLIGGVAALVVCLIAGVIVFNNLFNNAAPATDAPVIPNTGNAAALAASPVTQATSQPTATAKPTTIPQPIAKATATKITIPTPTTESKFFTIKFDENSDLSKFASFENGIGNEQKLNITSKNNGLEFLLNDTNLNVYFIYQSQTYQDVAIKLQAENTGEINKNNVSLVCRQVDTGWYEFSVTNGGLWYLYDYTNGNYNTIGNGGTNAMNLGQSVNDYEMRCVGSNISLYVNGVLIKTVSNSLHTEGRVGFNIASYDAYPVKVLVSNFEVSEP